ncbi:MAG TPA: nucleotidyltransferase [Blastocatellia bacterium]|nr:nucleotidyltransferase [Blastocatellia bacterium]
MLALVESDKKVFNEVLDEAVESMFSAGVPYVMMGGISASANGGSRFTTHDIDIFVKPQDADRALNALRSTGFETEKTDPKWLYKGFKNNVMVDIIFKSSGEVCLDDEMLERSWVADFNGRSVRVLSREDLFVIKSLVLNEHTLAMDDRCTRHLVDLVGVIRSGDLDWEYLIRRARRGPRRVLSMLLFAQSLDLLVPNTVIKTLFDILEIA